MSEHRLIYKELIYYIWVTIVCCGLLAIATIQEITETPINPLPTMTGCNESILYHFSLAKCHLFCDYFYLFGFLNHFLFVKM